MKYIGVSIPHCICDILKGRITIEDIVAILTQENEIEEHVDKRNHIDGAELFWKDFGREKYEAVFNELVENDLIQWGVKSAPTFSDYNHWWSCGGLPKRFILHWLHGGSEIVEGPDIATACNNAGIGGGAIGALDYYEVEK